MAVQWSYAVTGVDDTAAVGILNYGASGGVSFTDAGNVYELLGRSSSMGGGPPSPLIDMHMIESNTKEFISFNIFELVGDALNFIFGRSEDIGCIN